MSAGGLLDLQQVGVVVGSDQILWAVTLTVAQGEIVTLVGPNGAGKSTLLKTISGLIPLVAGEVRFAGHSLQGLAPADIVELGLIHVSEGRHLFPDMSVIDNLKLGAYARRARGGCGTAWSAPWHCFPCSRSAADSWCAP